MYAPRAKIESIYIVSPIKVAIIFLTILHCLFLFVAFLASFWVETKSGHYGPLFSCEKHCHGKDCFTSPIITQCYLKGFSHDIHIFSIPLTTIVLILSFFTSIVSIITANSSFVKKNFTLRQRCWLCTIILLLLVCLMDCFILVSIPLSYRHKNGKLRWAYGVHCGATLFIFVSLIAAILTRHIDDVQYVEAIEESTEEK